MPVGIMRVAPFHFRILVVFFFVSQVLFSGCFIGKTSPEPYPIIESSGIKQKIASLEKQLKDTGIGRERAVMLVRLAMLYSHPSNPRPDYKRAVECLKEYGASNDTVDVNYALVLLKQLEVLVRENDRLRTQLGDLSRKNSEYRDIIEKLKRLDIRLEKKRKNTL